MSVNSVLKVLEEYQNQKTTTNGAIAFKSTLNNVYDMFAFAGAYRNRSDRDCILLFKNAYEEDPDYALKCLFYISDCRGGQGERRFFRVCFNWLANTHEEVARKLIELIPVYRRWDDIFYSCYDTPVQDYAFRFVAKQLLLDSESTTPSLAAKWVPSENCSSKKAIRMANAFRQFLQMTHKQYRQMLSSLRQKINILERLMSENRWDEIEFDKIPSKAGLVYKNVFATKEVTAKRYEEFIKNKNTKVNAGTLYPYEVVGKAINCFYKENNNIERMAINKYWDNLEDYFNGQPSDILCVVDTSGSMTWSPNGNILPIHIAISLGIYAGEHAKGAFANRYISFSSRPQLIKIEGVDFVDKVKRIYDTNLCEYTNLTSVFNLLLTLVTSGAADPKDLPKTIVILSDMEIDSVLSNYHARDNQIEAVSEMGKIRAEWERHGLEVPRLVYWNVNAFNNTILDKGDKVTFVSGANPIIFKQIITGKNGLDLMYETLNQDRYKEIHT